MQREQLHDIRRKRLAELVAEAGNQAEFARIIGRNSGYVSRLLSGDRALGEKLAREIERSTGRPAWWLDGYPAEGQPAGMAEARSNRRKRLAELVAEAGNQAEFARIIGRSSGYVRRLLSGDLALGEKLAREIERFAGRPALWLDGYSAEDQPASMAEAPVKHAVQIRATSEVRATSISFLQKLDEEIRKQGFIAVVEEVDEYLGSNGIDWASTQRAEVYWRLHQLWCNAGGDLRQVKRYVRAHMKGEVHHARRKR